MEESGAIEMFPLKPRPHHDPEPVPEAALAEARFRKFLRDFRAYEQHAAFEMTLDAFLDLYSTWMKRHEPSLKIRLVMLAFELHQLDPAFECTLAFSD